MDEIEFDGMDENELVEVAKVLSRRLIEGIIRESRLVSERDAIRNDYEERGCGLQGIHNSRDKIQKELDEAREQIQTLRILNKDLEGAGKGFATEADELREETEKLQRQLSETRSDLSLKEMSVRRLERELREARRTVMDEVSAMIPKAVQAERDACADIARAEALRCAQSAPTNILMEIVNKIKARGERK